MRLFTRRGERGAVLPEAAIVLPIVMVFVLGILEYGLFFRDSLTTSNISRDGARVGSAANDDYDADYYILQQVKQDAVALNGGVASIDYVVIYNASGPGSPGPGSTCGAGTPVAVSDGSNGTADTIGACDVYVPSDFNRPKSDFDNATTVFSPGTGPLNWPGPARNQYHDASHPRSDSPLPSGQPDLGPDYIGVYVHMTHHFITGLFGQTVTVTDSTMLKIERRY
jgi:hypothetical protein